MFNTGHSFIHHLTAILKLSFKKKRKHIAISQYCHIMLTSTLSIIQMILGGRNSNYPYGIWMDHKSLLSFRERFCQVLWKVLCSIKLSSFMKIFMQHQALTVAGNPTWILISWPRDWWKLLVVHVVPLLNNYWQNNCNVSFSLKFCFRESTLCFNNGPRGGIAPHRKVN